MLSEKSLRSGLKTKVFGRKIFSFESIDSTNDCAKALGGCGAPEGVVVIAEEQTAGKGRLGRAWITRPHENLTFSILLKPDLGVENLSLFPFFAAVSVAAAVERLTGLKVECKWPNDLLLSGKKFAGILLEGSIKQNAIEYVIIGIGINVNQQVFPSELSSLATSLTLETKSHINREKLFRETLVQLEWHYKEIAAKGMNSVMPGWLERSTMLNQPVSVLLQGETITGVMRGLSAEGGLVLAVDGAERTVHAGDTTILKR